MIGAGEASKQTELIILHGGVEDWSFPTLARGDIHTLYMLNNMVLNASRCKVHDMGEVNVTKDLFTFGKAKGDLESSRAGFMRSPVLASWGSLAGRTSGMAIVHCNLYLLLIYLYLLLITHYVFTYCQGWLQGEV